MNATGVPYLALQTARGSDTLAMSQPVFDEVSEVLHRPGLQRWVVAALRTDLLNQLRSGALWFATTAAVTDCRNPSDNKCLDPALTARASLIVSSDADLLVLHPWRGISVLRPTAYLLTTRPGPHRGGTP